MKLNLTNLTLVAALLSFVSAYAVTAPALIPQTGQTTSYATGDDGSLKKGTYGTNAAGRFVVNGDCLTDQQTGLMWPKNGIIGFEATSGGGLIAQPDYNNTTVDLNTLTWAQALAAVAKMDSAGVKLCGYSDWRVPNRNELRSLVNYGQSNVASWLNDQGFSNVQVSYYLSSTTYAGRAGDTTYAWDVNMGVGSVREVPKTSASYYVWPVRGGQ